MRPFTPTLPLISVTQHAMARCWKHSILCFIFEGVGCFDKAVWNCDSFKSPGPDGINFGFIKDFWPELKDNIMRFITEYYRNGKLSKGINSTFIALIPKVDSPRYLNDFRPISLVGSLYKVLAKVIANRLRQVIGSVVSEAQSAFVKNRQILDGILIANEVVDEARKCKKELLLFKMDFEKAYNLVDWRYLDAVMERMSFPALWRKWIMECEYIDIICFSEWLPY